MSTPQAMGAGLGNAASVSAEHGPVADGRPPAATALQGRLDSALDAAEAQHHCAIASGDALARAFMRRAQQQYCLSPAPGLYVRPSYWRELNPREQAFHLMHGLGRLHPTWTFRSWAAALSWGIEVPYPLLEELPIISKRQPSPPYPVISRSPYPSDRVETSDGIRVLSLPHAVGEVLRQAPFSYALAVIDSALHAQNSNEVPSFLAEVEHACQRRDGAARARFILRFADARAESGGESRVRAFLIANGYELPDLQITFTDPCDQNHVLRVDFFWRLPDGRNLIGEFDGMAKYHDPDLTNGEDAVAVLVRERQRESRLTLLGYPVLRFTYDDLSHPARLHHLLRTAGIPQDSSRALQWHKTWAQLDKKTRTH